jgi:hypothetical protein
MPHESYCRLSVTVPSVSSNALGYGAFLGIYANLRYQLLCGFDRGMVRHFDVIGVALFFSTAFRYASPPPHTHTPNELFIELNQFKSYVDVFVWSFV